MAAAFIASPLFYYLWTHSGAEQRLTMLDAPLQALAQGDLSPLLGNARDAVRMFFARLTTRTLPNSRWREPIYNCAGPTGVTR